MRLLSRPSCADTRQLDSSIKRFSNKGAGLRALTTSFQMPWSRPCLEMANYNFVDDNDKHALAVHLHIYNTVPGGMYVKNPDAISVTRDVMVV